MHIISGLSVEVQIGVLQSLLPWSLSTVEKMTALLDCILEGKDVE